MQTHMSIPRRSRGRPFPPGHTFGHRFHTGDDFINYAGRPRIDHAMRRAYEAELARPFPKSEIDRLPRWLRPHVREHAKEWGGWLNYCQVLAIARGILCLQGNVAAAREIRLTTEGKGA